MIDEIMTYLVCRSCHLGLLYIYIQIGEDEIFNNYKMPTKLEFLRITNPKKLSFHEIVTSCLRTTIDRSNAQLTHAFDKSSIAFHEPLLLYSLVQGCVFSASGPDAEERRDMACSPLRSLGGIKWNDVAHFLFSEVDIIDFNNGKFLSPLTDEFLLKTEAYR